MRNAILLINRMWCYDFSTVLQVFDGDISPIQNTDNHLSILSPFEHVRLNHNVVVTPEALGDPEGYDLVITPGFFHPTPMFSESSNFLQPLWHGQPACEMARQWLIRAHAAGADVASLGTGTFFLGWAGLIDGVEVTTHWMFSDILQRRFPHAIVRPESLFVHDEAHRIWTCGGGTSSLDLCLTIMRHQYGQGLASSVSRTLLTSGARSNNNPQCLPERSSGSERKDVALSKITAPVLAHPEKPWTVDSIAALGNMSARTLQRRFQMEYGKSAIQWLLEQRLAIARELLETTTLTTNMIAKRVGMSSSDLLRKNFQTHLGMSPAQYRKQYNARRNSSGREASHIGNK